MILKTGFSFGINLQVIRLSAATQDYPNSVVCNVHGVNPRFLEIGKKKLEEQQNGQKPFTRDAYYIGKMVWSKGYKELLKLLHDHQKELSGLKVDLYGSGEDSDQVQEAAKTVGESVTVHPGLDHADPLFHECVHQNILFIFILITLIVAYMMNLKMTIPAIWLPRVLMISAAGS